VNVQFLNGTSVQKGYLVPFKVYMIDSMQGGMKKSRFSTNILLYLANHAR